MASNTRPALVKRTRPHPAEGELEPVEPGETPPLPRQGSSTTPLVQFSVRVPAELRQEYRLQAIREGRQVQELAREALERYLKER